MDIIEEFEGEVGRNLRSLGVDLGSAPAVGVAVSGGADSVSLLSALHRLLPQEGGLCVVTVNHNLRPAAETEGDADFVEDYCARLGVPCERRDIARGAVAGLARGQDIGVEAAARRLRYEAFEDFCSRRGLACLCLAHNQDDQLETMLMRFLQGGCLEALSGMQMRRGRYLRPLLTVPRSRIEAYLRALRQEWRTDSTNGDDAMLRNRLRHAVLPVLDGVLPGWRKSVSALGGRLAEDGAALRGLADAAVFRTGWRDSGRGVSLDAAGFAGEVAAVRRRLLYAAFSRIRAEGRVPSSLVERVLGRNAAAAWREQAAGVEVTCDGKNIFVQKGQNLATESGFSVIIERVGAYRIGPMDVRVVLSEDGATLSGAGSSVTIPCLRLPFMVRSRQPGDVVRAADGTDRPLARILDDWKCGRRKDMVPVVQELSDDRQRIVCVWGGAVGLRNWIVRECV